jgi:hypothetical protein
MLIRSCSARVAMMLITTSRMTPQESKNGSMKLRHATPYAECRGRRYFRGDAHHSLACAVAMAALPPLSGFVRGGLLGVASRIVLIFELRVHGAVWFIGCISIS